MTDQRKLENERKCGANRYLIFRGAIAKDEVDNFSGKDVVHLILVFSDDLSFRLFDPREAVSKKNSQASTLASLCTALGCDWNDVPNCFGWEDYAATIVKFLEPHKRKAVYAKVTLNSGGWPALGTDNHIIPQDFIEESRTIIYGTDRCFSAIDDLQYSESDMTYLSHTEGDLSHPAEQRGITPPSKDDYSDLPF